MDNFIADKRRDAIMAGTSLLVYLPLRRAPLIFQQGELWESPAMSSFA